MAGAAPFAGGGFWIQNSVFQSNQRRNNLKSGAWGSSAPKPAVFRNSPAGSRPRSLMVLLLVLETALRFPYSLSLLNLFRNSRSVYREIRPPGKLFFSLTFLLFLFSCGLRTKCRKHGNYLLLLQSITYSFSPVFSSIHSLCL